MIILLLGLAGEEWSNIWLAHGGYQEVEEPDPDITLKICRNLQKICFSPPFTYITYTKVIYICFLQFSCCIQAFYVIKMKQ